MTSRVRADASAFNEPSNSSSSSNTTSSTSTTHPQRGYTGGSLLENCQIGKMVETDKKVTLNNTKKEYAQGSKKIDIHVKDSTVNDSNLGLIKTVGSGPATIKSCFTPEQLVQMLLKSGIATEDLKKLLENKYLITNLAFALEGNKSKEILTALTSTCPILDIVEMPKKLIQQKLNFGKRAAPSKEVEPRDSGSSGSHEHVLKRKPSESGETTAPSRKIVKRG